jgi:hypothetical protein
VESAINALEAHGLDGLQRYVALAVVGRNLHRLGAFLLPAEVVLSLALGQGGAHADDESAGREEGEQGLELATAQTHGLGAALSDRRHGLAQMRLDRLPWGAAPEVIPADLDDDQGGPMFPFCRFNGITSLARFSVLDHR